MDSTMVSHGSLIIVVNGVWFELSVVTGEIHWLKSDLHSTQKAPEHISSMTLEPLPHHGS